MGFPQLRSKQFSFVRASDLSEITGTLAVTNADDTLAAAGTTTVVGTLAVTNANDTLSAAGTTTVIGTLATTNASDTLSASGTVGEVTGTLAYTNANDTLNGSGTTTVLGTLARTNANDTLSAAGTTTVTGSLATTNADDTLAATGTAGAVIGTLDYTNNDDTLSASGSAQTGKTQGGGRGKRRKYQLEIDGELFDVASEAHAIEILEKIRQEAKEKAELAIQRANKAQRRPTRKILYDTRRALTVPDIKADFEPAKQILEEIRDMYRDTLRTVEISALLKQQDNEEEILLILL